MMKKSVLKGRASDKTINVCCACAAIGLFLIVVLGNGGHQTGDDDSRPAGSIGGDWQGVVWESGAP